MASEPQAVPQPGEPADRESVEMPRPTVAPLVLALGLVLLAAGVVAGTAFLIVGAVVLVTGLGYWIVQWLPHQGHIQEPLVEPARRSRPVTGQPGTVTPLREGMVGYRFRLPLEVHPISAGLKGGILGGLVMPLPALAYGLFSGHGIWFPVNLLAGMVLPGVGAMTTPELEQFQPGLLLLGLVIHATMAVVLGLIYGVLMPTLPDIPQPLAWGGLMMPLLWTAVSFTLMGVVNPVLARGVEWPWFILSQLIFGVVAALVVMRTRKLQPVPAGLLGGLVGGMLMAVPAVLWSLATGHGLWYPVNLLAGMVLPGMQAEALEQFRPDWLAVALLIHLAMSLGFGLVYGLLLPKLPVIPGPLVWGGVLLPLLWTATSYGLMGVVNPVLQEKVNWPWFVVSQFVFGVVAAVVVLRSETIPVPPAGSGPSLSPRQGDTETRRQGEQT